MINTRHIDSLMNPDRWWLLWVVLVTEQLQLVDATFMDTIMWTNDGASPRPHVDVICIIHSIAHGSISNALFTTFKLF